MSTPFQPLPCDAGAGAAAAVDVEGTLVCDVDAAGEVVGTALVEAVYDDAGVRTGTRLVNVLDGTLYVPVGTVQPCREGCCPEPVVLCDVQPDGSTVQFIRAYTGDETGAVESADTTLDGAPYAPTGTVGACDPYRLCTPSSDQDLAAACGPGESVEQQIVLDHDSAPLANSTFNDDASADPLCGGTWDRSADEPPAPFPVDETFRNLTFDQPGPVLQGTAPYPDLTADVDGAGAGWLQLSDINSGTNGLWQVPGAFPTSEGMNAGITLASHDGTVPGGDGMAFVFTSGAVPAQGIPVGGFGNLGLQNWQGGYVAVVLDEYGQTCTCSQAPQGTITGDPGPCGFCTNTISIQLAGAARQGASCACCTLASASLAPKALNQTTRSTPARLLTSIIEEGGQTYVSASIDWNDGNGPVQYFDRVNVTACAGPAPATLRMAAYGGSGGSFRAVKEIRDAVARPAGISNWRAFPITTGPIPACTQLVNVSAEVDVTFTADDQDAGNGNPEAYLWLVNTVTGAVLDVATATSLPSQVGTVHHLTVSAGVAPADVPNLRVYVGAESRDDTGAYASLWENLEVAAVGTGCPATPQRTLAISAPCPIPVTIVGGDGEGGGGGTTIVNTPATFEDAPICMTVDGDQRPGFRREVRSPDGTVTVTFLGDDGLPATPTAWTPGACDGGCRDASTVLLCDDPGESVVVLALDIEDATSADVGQPQFTNLPPPYAALWSGGSLVYPAGAGPAQDHRAATGRMTADTTGCEASAGTLTVSVRVTQNGPGTGQLWDGALRLFRGTTLLAADDVALYAPPGHVQTLTASVPVTAADLTSGDLYAAVILETFHGTPKAWTADEFSATVELEGCTATQAIQFFRTITTDCETGEVVETTDTTLDGAPYVVTGDVGQCAPASSADPCVHCEAHQLCDVQDDSTTVFLRTTCRDCGGAVRSVLDTELDGVTPYGVAGVVGACNAECCPDAQLVELCDDNGTFERRFLFDAAGALIGTADYDLAGAPYVPVGPVTYGCTTPDATAQVIASCEDVGSAQFVTGPNLLTNGDLEQSSGLAASSVAGPGWVTSYAACGPNLFAAPCGASTWAFFNTNAGQVTGGNATATQIEALGARSMAVNVGPNTAIPIIEWANVLLENGQTYELAADAAIIFGPYDVAIKVGGSAAPGGLFPLSVPPVGNWGTTSATFTYAGPTGYTSVGLYSNSGVAGGNDHTFDNFSLHAVTEAQAEVLTPVIYAGTQRAVIDQVVETVGCNDDRRDALLGAIADTIAPRSAATLDATVQRQTGAGAVAIPAGARSVTVSVLTGPVTVDLGQGVTTLPTGLTLSWTVDGLGETLAEAFTFTGVVGSDFIVTSTRQ